MGRFYLAIMLRITSENPRRKCFNCHFKEFAFERSDKGEICFNSTHRGYVFPSYFNRTRTTSPLETELQGVKYMPAVAQQLAFITYSDLLDAGTDKSLAISVKVFAVYR